MKVTRTIRDVLSLKTGDLLDSEIIFQNQDKNEALIFQMRSKIEEQLQNDTIDYVCLYCKQPIVVRGRKDLYRKTTHFYFQHLYRSNDCIVKSNSKLTEEEVRCVKYNGVKESDLHNQLKNEIAYYLGLTKNITVIIDKVFKNKAISNQWRKPDVLAILLDKKIAFELQLSTTFLSVIVGRTLFYQKNGIFLIWIFHKFSLENDLQKFTQKDVYYNNNFNVYVFDELAKAKSIKAKELILRCYYKKYESKNNELSECWVDTFIKLTDLVFDFEYFKLHYFDSDESRIKELNSIEMTRRIESESTQLKLRQIKVDRALDSLRKLYIDGYLLGGQNTFMDEIETDVEIKMFNDKLNFSKDKAYVIANSFLDDSKIAFLSLICKENKILVDTTFRFKDEKTILEKIIPFEEVKFKRYASRLFFKGYKLTNSDKHLLDFTFEDNSKENTDKSRFIFYLSSINKKYAMSLYLIEKEILNPLLSLKKGVVIGSKLANLLQICNNTLEYRKSFAVLFIRAMKVYKRYDELLKNDRKGSLQLKIMKFNEEQPLQNNEYNEIIYSIFPELTPF